MCNLSPLSSDKNKHSLISKMMKQYDMTSRKQVQTQLRSLLTVWTWAIILLLQSMPGWCVHLLHLGDEQNQTCFTCLTEIMSSNERNV